MKNIKSKYTVLQQICKIIPGFLVKNLAVKHEVDKQARSFSPWSHVVAMLYVHIAHSLSLNDVVDTLRNHSGILTTIRNATPPSRNGLSHANKIRSADMAEELFWQVLKHLQSTYPDFGFGHKYSGVPKRFKRVIVAVDSSTIQLVANCISWAKHRKQKAAAKCHMQLNLQSFLPQFAIVKSAGTHDSTEAYELCANLKDGEIVVFDKAYVDFKHLYQLDTRGVFWVTRSKDNMRYRIVEECKTTKSSNILGDYIIELERDQSKDKYPRTMRLVIAEVEVNNKTKVMSFITNNIEWASSSICDLYRARWGVEVFFKQIKQTLQLGAFLGYSENAIRWQVWMAMLAYVLIRFISYMGQWKGSFSRLFTLLRGVLTSRLDMYSVMQACYGTAADNKRVIPAHKQVYLPGFDSG